MCSSLALRMAFLLLLLISATWLLGLMAVNSNVMTFHYLFAIFSCLQVTVVLFLTSVFPKQINKASITLTIAHSKARYTCKQAKQPLCVFLCTEILQTADAGWV